MKTFGIISVLLLCAMLDFHASAQTAASLFRLSDSLQVAEIVSDKADMYGEVGHHGPAVENSHMALRIYFNDSGAIDLYSKSGRGMELMPYLWYPSPDAVVEYGAGSDMYFVGKTLGLGGIALWDGERMVRLTAGKGRTARVGQTKKGHFAEMISYGVPYCGDTVDVCIRIEVLSGRRDAMVTAEEISGRKLSFVTGVNFHPGQSVVVKERYVCVWGVHPSDVSDSPVPLGAGISYSKGDFLSVENVDGMVRMVSKPTSRLSTRVYGASALEAELNSAKRFEDYIAR